MFKTPKYTPEEQAAIDAANRTAQQKAIIHQANCEICAILEQLHLQSNHQLLSILYSEAAIVTGQSAIPTPMISKFVELNPTFTKDEVATLIMQSYNNLADLVVPIFSVNYQQYSML